MHRMGKENRPRDLPESLTLEGVSIPPDQDMGCEQSIAGKSVGTAGAGSGLMREIENDNGTPKDQLVNQTAPKEKAGLEPEEIAKMEREMESLERDFKSIESTY